MSFLLIRPDSWNFPLFLHVAGAMLVTASLVVAVAALALAWRAEGEERAAITRFGFRTLLIAGIPSYFLMHGAAEWIVSRENIPSDNEPGWVGLGYGLADFGGILMLLATILAWLGARRSAVRRRRRPRQVRHGARDAGRRHVRRRDLGDDDQAVLGLSGPSPCAPAHWGTFSESARTLGEGSVNQRGGVGGVHVRAVGESRRPCSPARGERRDRVLELGRRPVRRPGRWAVAALPAGRHPVEAGLRRRAFRRSAGPARQPGRLSCLGPGAAV